MARNPYFDKKTGYWMVWLPDGSRTTLHRKIMEDHLGVKLDKDQLVHHKNHIKTDNWISNFEVKPRWAHSADHGKKPFDEVYLVKKCLVCRKSFNVPIRRLRYKKRNTPYDYCSRSCGAKAQWKRGDIGKRFIGKEHGTGNCYRYYKCRCRPCRDAVSLEARIRRASKKKSWMPEKNCRGEKQITREPHKLETWGATPLSATKINAGLAHSVERSSEEREVAGAEPAAGTKKL